MLWHRRGNPLGMERVKDSYGIFFPYCSKRGIYNLVAMSGTGKSKSLYVYCERYTLVFANLKRPSIKNKSKRTKIKTEHEQDRMIRI